MSPETVPLIAYEGINRVGKNTQIDRLKTVLEVLGISFVELRGDGTRDGSGKHRGDPFSQWWQQYAQYLRNSGTTADWNFAAYILAQELKNWRANAQEVGVQMLLLDRSLISRAAFLIDRMSKLEGILFIDDLYPIQPTGELTIENILPDVIFELVAPKEIVLARLDPTDVKFAFRLRLIEETYENFYGAKSRLPAQVQDRIVQIDASQPIDRVFDAILETLDKKMTNWKMMGKV